jgi:ribonuclease HII
VKEPVPEEAGIEESLFRLPHASQTKVIEAGLDEAGRGPLAGPVYAAAVILLPFEEKPWPNVIRDSKTLIAAQREEAREWIIENAFAWSIASADAHEIDAINILKASHLAMHRAVHALAEKEIHPGWLAVDGNRFAPMLAIGHTCFIKGDGRFANIAAASILAKTERDAYMRRIHEDFPEFNWAQNKGYPTPDHLAAIRKYGYTEHHRRTFSPVKFLL